MQAGKVKEAVLKRSVLRQISHNSTESTPVLCVGQDAGRIAMAEDVELLSSIATMQGNQTCLLKCVTHRAANNIFAKGGDLLGISVSLLLRSEAKEKDLKGYIQQLAECSKQLGIQILSGETATGNELEQTVITVHAIGRAKKEPSIDVRQQEIVMTKWIGMAGTELLLEDRKEELSRRFSERFLLESKTIGEQLSIKEEMRVLAPFAVTYAHDVSEGGIFGALWELGEYLDCGMEISMDEILVRQETIEICEVLDLNPYLLFSGGSVIFIVEQGEMAAQLLRDSGIPAAVIGKITKSKDRFVRNREEIRYLEPFRGDEIYKA